MGKILDGRKTYLTMFVIIALGALDAYNQHCAGTGTCMAYAVPGWVYSILGGLGICTRSQAKTGGEK